MEHATSYLKSMMWSACELYRGGPRVVGATGMGCGRAINTRSKRHEAMHHESRGYVGSRLIANWVLVPSAELSPNID